MESSQGAPPYAPPAPPHTGPPAGANPYEERNWAMWAHLSALSGLLIPLGNLLGPILLWALSKDKGPFAAYHGKEALNFQIGVTIALAVLGAVAFVSIALAFLLLPILLTVLAFIAMGVIYIGALILVVIAGLAASRGEWYRYPISVRLIQ